MPTPCRHLMLSAQPDSDTATRLEKDKSTGRTLAWQSRLPKLPIPPLEDTCKRYLRALEALQDKHEHEATTAAVQEFLLGEGPRIQQELIEWAKDKAR